MKCKLVISCDNFSEAVNEIIFLQKKGVFESFEFDKGRIDGEVVYLVATLKLTNKQICDFSTLKNDETLFVFFNETKTVLLIYEIVNNTIKYVYGEDINSHKEYNKIRHNSNNITNYFNDEQMCVYNASNEIWKSILKILMDNNNEFMSTNSIRNSVGLKGPAESILLVMEHKGLLKSIYIDKEKYYRINNGK